jgi:acylglycerol lipase
MSGGWRGWWPQESAPLTIEKPPRLRHGAASIFKYYKDMTVPEATLLAAKEEYLWGTNGPRLFLRSWQPEGVLRGIVAICHGFNSHGAYYAWTAKQLLAAGYAVYVLDLRGRGRSDGERYYIDHIDDYVSDIGHLIDLIHERQPGVPLYLLGHSSGGVVACLYALENPGKLSGLIVKSFAFELYAPDFALAVLEGLSHVAPHRHILAIDTAHFSRDAEALKVMDSDPLIADEVQPTMTLAALVHADHRLKTAFGDIALPLLILHGTADKATRPHGSLALFEAAGAEDKTLKLYDGHFHDLLNDLDRETVMADIIEWLDARTEAAPA